MIDLDVIAAADADEFAGELTDDALDREPGTPAFFTTTYSFS